MKCIAEIRERMKRLDEPAGEDYLALLDMVLHQDLPFLLNLVEKLSEQAEDTRVLQEFCAETDRLLGRES